MRRVVTVIMSAMTSAAASAVLALPDRPANPAHAAGPAAPPARVAVPHCYHPGNRVTVRLDLEVRDADYGVAYDSQLLYVRAGSPCRDINVRDPRNAAGPAVGQSACTLVKVMFGDTAATEWIDTCGSWRVLARYVREGRPFVLRAALRPVDVTVAT